MFTNSRLPLFPYPELTLIDSGPIRKPLEGGCAVQHLTSLLLILSHLEGRHGLLKNEPPADPESITRALSSYGKSVKRRFSFL